MVTRAFIVVAILVCLVELFLLFFVANDLDLNGLKGKETWNDRVYIVDWLHFPDVRCSNLRMVGNMND